MTHSGPEIAADIKNHMFFMPVTMHFAAFCSALTAELRCSAGQHAAAEIGCHGERCAPTWPIQVQLLFFNFGGVGDL